MGLNITRKDEIFRNQQLHVSPDVYQQCLMSHKITNCKIFISTLKLTIYLFKIKNFVRVSYILTLSVAFRLHAT